MPEFIVTADGARLAYRVEGKGDTIIVLHGGPGFSSESLRPDLQPLAKTHTLVYYDQRGSGFSSTLDSSRISLDHHVQDLERVREHFRLARVVLLGHSWGGGLAARYALAHPERIARLLLVDPMPLRRDPYIGQLGRNVMAWMDSTTRQRLTAAAQARTTGVDAIAACRTYLGILLRGYLAEPRGTVRILGDPCVGTEENANNSVYRYTLGTLGAWDWRGDMRAISAPVLIVHGEKDPLPLESSIEWVAALPNARLMVIPRSGHWPHVEQPELFFQSAEQFLAGEWPARSAR